ncbi:hypothetical protein HU200_056032 [Digitaria exilis]|uniref:Uncharacterized protein n=1 Tax=Digitaria exilis TaxID=1010633 RepID=A0A835E618_9POAL|nr:hypothetical protein HU200_056032 [Digitaria exilis]
MVPHPYSSSPPQLATPPHFFMCKLTASPSIYVLYGERKTTTADEETDANPAIVIMEDTTSRFFSVFPLWFPFKVPPIDILVLVVYGFEGHCTPPKRASAGADHANCASPATAPAPTADVTLHRSHSPFQFDINLQSFFFFLLLPATTLQLPLPLLLPQPRQGFKAGAISIDFAAGGMAMAVGFVVMLFGASVGVTFGGGVFGPLLSFAGVLAGAKPHRRRRAFDGARALRALILHRHLAVVGLAMASCAVTAVSGEAGTVLCIGICEPSVNREAGNHCPLTEGGIGGDGLGRLECQVMGWEGTGARRARSNALCVTTGRKPDRGSATTPLLNTLLARYHHPSIQLWDLTGTQWRQREHGVMAAGAPEGKEKEVRDEKNRPTAAKPNPRPSRQLNHQLGMRTPFL